VSSSGCGEGSAGLFEELMAVTFARRFLIRYMIMLVVLFGNRRIATCFFVLFWSGSSLLHVVGVSGGLLSESDKDSDRDTQDDGEDESLTFSKTGEVNVEISSGESISI
jgi:hypothetical protein